MPVALRTVKKSGSVKPSEPTIASGSPETKPTGAARGKRWESPEAFVRDIWPHAERTAERLGVEPRAVVAQAALETGWGAHVMQRRDGSSSFNLFGIKAGSDWSGDSVIKPTLEFRNGLPQHESARFRAYADLGAAFADYADFLTGRPRYATALESAGDGRRFAASLQAAGYATDPLYAAKISRIMQSETMEASMAALKPGRGAPITTAAATLSAR